VFVNPGHLYKHHVHGVKCTGSGNYFFYQCTILLRPNHSWK